MDRSMRPDMPMGGASPGSGSRIVAGAGLAFIALAASQVSTGLLTVVVALAAAAAAASLARDFEAVGLNAPPLLYAAAALALPLAVFLFREPGLAGAAAALVFVAAARWVLCRPARAAAESLAALVPPARYRGRRSASLIL